MKKHTLFCIPYAGGSKNIFSPLKTHIIDTVTIKPLELPGHGTRFSEPLKKNIEDMADDITNKIIEYGEKNFSILGYSLGAIILYETYFKLKNRGFSLPKNLIICSKEPIGYKKKFDDVNNMSNFTFKNFIRNIGGTPEEVLNNKELWELIAPILKNDFIALDNYENKQKNEQCKSSIYVFVGNSDNIDKNLIYKWSDIAYNRINYKFFEGSHFFLFDNYKNISNELNKIIYLSKDDENE
ncbi:thioesterase II family protein [Staphylococcus capitis]|uniref:thioesterase II family protein n=1 Tax=Staphylococcus capitis TaxID=29388 RepID=UPI00301A5CB8